MTTLLHITLSCGGLTNALSEGGAQYSQLSHSSPSNARMRTCASFRNCSPSHSSRMWSVGASEWLHCLQRHLHFTHPWRQHQSKDFLFIFHFDNGICWYFYA